MSRSRFERVGSTGASHMKASSLFVTVAAYVIALPALAAAPTITQINFGLTTTPQTVTLTGTGFLSTTTVKLSNGTTNLTVAMVSSTTLKANLPSGLVAGDYTLTAANGTAAATWNITYGAVGPTGAPGPQGATGATGTAATVAVGTTITGAPGSLATVTNTGKSSAAVFNFTIPRGATGPVGPTGSPGGAGPAGQIGPAGPAGAAGANGAPGTKGDKGDVGPQGPAGVTGKTQSALKLAMHRWYGNNQSGVSIPIPAEAGGAVFDGAHVWVASRAAHSILKVRAADMTVVGDYSTGSGTP